MVVVVVGIVVEVHGVVVGGCVVVEDGLVVTGVTAVCTASAHVCGGVAAMPPLAKPGPREPPVAKRASTKWPVLPPPAVTSFPSCWMIRATASLLVSPASTLPPAPNVASSDPSTL